MTELAGVQASLHEDMTSWSLHGRQQCHQLGRVPIPQPCLLPQCHSGMRDPCRLCGLCQTSRLGRPGSLSCGAGEVRQWLQDDLRGSYWRLCIFALCYGPLFDWSGLRTEAWVGMNSLFPSLVLRLGDSAWHPSTGTTV